MRPTFALPFLLALAPPLAAQATTHLNVPSSQLVDVFFWRSPTAANVYVMGGLTRADGLFLGNSIPAGKLLILRDAQASFSVGARTVAQTLIFDFIRARDAGNGGIYSYGADKNYLLRVGISTYATSEGISFDFPAGMAFTDLYRPRLTIAGQTSLVSNMLLSASGYLVDAPAGQITLARQEFKVVPAREEAQ